MKPFVFARFQRKTKHARDVRWIGVGMSSPEYLIYRQRRGRVQNTDQVGRHVHLVASRVKKKPVATRFGEDQLKLASLSSGVEVALVVSASINWGKRCPHFLAETRRAARNRKRKRKRKGVVRTSRHSARHAAAVTRPAFGLTKRSILRDRSISRRRFKFPRVSIFCRLPCLRDGKRFAERARR